MTDISSAHQCVCMCYLREGLEKREVSGRGVRGSSLAKIGENALAEREEEKSRRDSGRGG